VTILVLSYFDVGKLSQSKIDKILFDISFVTRRLNKFIILSIKNKILIRLKYVIKKKKKRLKYKKLSLA
jgi:hypothetical protein